MSSTEPAPQQPEGVLLQSFLMDDQVPEQVPGGFHLMFEGELSHVLRFELQASQRLCLRCHLVCPAGTVWEQHRAVPAAAEPQTVTFALGPLLGHGPYRYRPGKFYPGEYLLTVEAREAQNGPLVFRSSFRLPPQEWIWADLNQLVYIDNPEAALDLWLLPGALLDTLPVVVDLIEPLSRTSLSPAQRVVLSARPTRVTFDLRALTPGVYQARVLPEFAGRVWPDGVARTLQLFRNGPQPCVMGTVHIGPGPQIFADDYLVDKASGLQSVFHPAKRVSEQPILAPDRPYEGHMLIVEKPPHYDAGRRQYEMTYTNVGYAYGAVRLEMLATSPDLVYWSKPDLGLVEIGGSVHNNVLRKVDETQAKSEFESFAGVWDYARRGNPDLRTGQWWLNLAGRSAVSADEWHFPRGFYLVVRDREGRSYVTTPTPVLLLGEGRTETMTGSGDTTADLGYDEQTGEYVVYTSPGPPNLGRGWVNYDNGYKARTIARHATRDGVNWEGRFIWVPDEVDPNIHSYGLRIRRLGDAYLGILHRYNVRTQHMDLQIWLSRDGIHWQALGDRQPWLENGPPGSFDWGSIHLVKGWCEESDRTRIFYTGGTGLHFHYWLIEDLVRGIQPESILTENAYHGRPYLAAPHTRGTSISLMPSGWSWRKGVHGTAAEARRQFWARLTAETGELPETHVPRGRDVKACVGAAEFRSNSFVSRRAGAHEGMLVTHPLIFEGSWLTVNAVAARGSLAVEVLDGEGNVIPGFARGACRLSPADGTQQPVRWEHESDLARLQGQAVRLRFYLREGDLFGFQIY